MLETLNIHIPDIIVMKLLEDNNEIDNVLVSLVEENKIAKINLIIELLLTTIGKNIYEGNLNRK